jgi:hypothetical protein
MVTKLEKTTPSGKRLPEGIFRRGGRYVIRYRSDGKARWETCERLDEAKTLLARRIRQTKLSRAHARGLHTDGPERECVVCQHEKAARERDEPTLREYAQSWIGSYQGRGRFEIRAIRRARTIGVCSIGTRSGTSIASTPA